MGLDLAFAATATYAKPEQFETFRRHIDAAWIEQAFAATGTATVRRRRLPAEEVVWVVLGMALFRDRPIEDVVSKLELALPGGGTVARSSVSQARARLGSEPMQWLFERSASEWAHASAAAHRWHGLALYGIDGSRLRVPDTPENRAHFGGQSGRQGSESGYPMARIVALMVLRSHLLAGVWLGPYGGTHELEPAKQLRTSIRDEWLWLSVSSPGAIPKRLESMRVNIKRYILPPRRPKRLYPRVVKLKMSAYDRKRPSVERLK
jgi:hypothetical protein